MTTQIVRVGNTLTVEIPVELVAQAALRWVSPWNGFQTDQAASPWSVLQIRSPEKAGGYDP